MSLACPITTAAHVILGHGLVMIVAGLIGALVRALPGSKLTIVDRKQADRDAQGGEEATDPGSICSNAWEFPSDAQRFSWHAERRFEDVGA